MYAFTRADIMYTKWYRRRRGFVFLPPNDFEAGPAAGTDFFLIQTDQFAYSKLFFVFCVKLVFRSSDLLLICCDLLPDLLLAAKIFNREAYAAFVLSLIF